LKNNLASRLPSSWNRDLRDLPIRQKLILIVMAITAVTLVLAGIGIIFADFVLFRGYLKNDLSALSQIIADNTTAPLSFQDPAAAAETLATLRARAHVVTACVFQNDGALFATYLRAGAIAACPAPQPGEDIRFDQGILSVSRPILLKNHRLGTLVLAYDLGEIYQRVQLYGATVVGVFLLSTLVAFLLSSRLRSLITTPIIELARVTTRVSSSRDYSIRAKKFSGDEMGVLVDTFNEMLSGIQSRDDELREALLAREAALEDAQKARGSLQSSLDSVAQLNAELRKSNESLARSNEDLERFAFIASHDLQEPLRMIIIYSQLLVRRYATIIEPQAAKFIQNIEDGTRRMRELLADLLAYAEIGARLDEPAQPVDLNFVVQKARESLALAIVESGAVITVARLPVVRGFASHFTPLFQNLIGNAIKYRSEQPLKIDIAAGRMNGYIQICVADNGIGIAPEYHSNIFVAFKRLHGKKIPGTGIGLAICQRVVERYGGRIWVESDVGQGSNFIFTLPANLLVFADGEKG
jgi:signal transduction histidine kinase